MPPGSMAPFSPSWIVDDTQHTMRPSQNTGMIMLWSVLWMFPYRESLWMKASPSRTPTVGSRVQYRQMNLTGYWQTDAKTTIPRVPVIAMSPLAVKMAVTRSPHLAPGATPICSTIVCVSSSADWRRPRTMWIRWGSGERLRICSSSGERGSRPWLRMISGSGP